MVYTYRKVVESKISPWLAVPVMPIHFFRTSREEKPDNFTGPSLARGERVGPQ
ncbi:MAG: hypothetical protein PVG49_03965 [Desulfobacteraceae bacterium]